MLDAIVYRQKRELERLMKLPYIERRELKKAKKWLSTNLIKVITGPRRSGKSVFALLMLQEMSFA
jgi:predicted AAA+ superfamily ATPase